ncbi:hypothetical protein V6Z11_D06G211000 [Gossypium hirsutum]
MATSDECCSVQLSDGDGSFNDTGIESFIKEVKLHECGLSYAVVSIMGPQSSVATPKQIRELMQVDGLTNDEVKSHLQKYQLHTRRLPATTTTTTPANQSGLVLGGGCYRPFCPRPNSTQNKNPINPNPFLPAQNKQKIEKERKPNRS